MNSQGPEELISAYFDGEASPEERAAVESLLRESDDVRRELNEIAKVSALLHSFPREFAPQSLPANVERLTSGLAQQQPAVPLPVVTTTQSAPSRMREWRAAFAGGLVTAASLMLVALGWRSFEEAPARHPVGDSVASAPALSKSIFSKSALPTAKEADAKLAEPVSIASLGNDSPNQEMQERKSELPISKSADSKVESAEEKEQLMAHSTPVVPGPATSGGMRPSVMAPRPAPASRTASGPAAAAPQLQQAPALDDVAMKIDPESRSISNSSNLITPPGVSRDEFLKNLEAGHIVQFADVDNNVGVITLDVVDVNRGAEVLEAMLIKHDVRPLSVEEKLTRDEGSANKRKSLKPTATKSEADDEKWMFIFTVATGEQSASALKDVQQHPDIFSNWSNGQPLPLDLKLAEYKSVNSKEKSDSDTAETAIRKENPMVDAEAERAVSTYLALTAQSAATSLDDNETRTKKDAAPEQKRGSDSANMSMNARRSMAKSAADQPSPVVADSKNEFFQQKISVNLNPADVTFNPQNNLASNGVAPQFGNSSNSMLRSRGSYGVITNNDAVARAEPSNRVRMLWVLHPTHSDLANQPGKPNP